MAGSAYGEVGRYGERTSLPSTYWPAPRARARGDSHRGAGARGTGKEGV